MKNDVTDFVFEEKLLRFSDAKRILKDLYESIVAVCGPSDEEIEVVNSFRNISQIDLVEAHNALMDELREREQA